MEEADGKPRRFFYGWVVVGISGLVFAVVRGINDSFGSSWSLSLRSSAGAVRQ